METTTLRMRRYRRTFGAAAIALLGVSCGSPDASDTALPMTYVGVGFPMGLATSQGSGLHFFDTPSPTQGFTKLPPDTGARRYYDQFRIAGATFRMITEETDPPRLYLDANHNGDVTDDPGPFVGERSGVVPNFYVVSLPYPKEKLSAEYRLWVFPSRMGGARFYAACHTVGELALPDSGKRFRLVLFDASADGDYSNDSLIVDVNDDGRAQESERLTPGRTLETDGVALRLKAIAPSGRSVVFARP
jgi:hypothetical protein